MPTECLCLMCGSEITDSDFRVVLCQEEYPEIEIGPYCENCLARIKICSGCHHPFHMDQTIHTGNGEHYCKECVSHLDLCGCCGKSTVGDSLTVIDGVKVCKTCFKREFFLCNSCNEYHNRSNSVHKNSLEGLRKAGIFRKYGEAVCNNCFTRRSPHFKTYDVSTCQHCGNHYTLTASHSSEKYCQRCYNSFSTCNICGEKEPLIHSIYIDGSYLSACSSCIKKLTKCDCCNTFTKKETYTVSGKFNRKYVVCHNCKNAVECKHCGKLTAEDICDDCKNTYISNVCNKCGRVRDQYGNCRVCDRTDIYSYSLKPRKWINSTEKDKTGDILFGFENEVTHGKSNAKMQKGLKALYASYDPTILVAKSDSSISGYGYEIVTQPMTLSFFSKLDLSNMFPTSLENNASCGLHVHVGREAFISDIHLYKICNFLLTNTEFVTYIAGRSFNSYCHAFRNKTSREVLRAKKTGDTERNQAVNLKNKYTVEFRLFAGCTSEDILRGRIEFLHALISYMKTTPISKANEIDPFIKYVRNNSKLYPNAGNLIGSYELH